MARFREVVADEGAMEEIVRLLTDVETPTTLPGIAKAWRVPYGKLAEWITESRERTEQYGNALRFVSDSDIHETVRLADGATAQDVQVRKLQIETRFRRAAKWDRSRYGDAVEHKHSGSVSLLAVLASLPSAKAEVDVTPSAELPAPEAQREEAFI